MAEDTKDTQNTKIYVIKKFLVISFLMVFSLGVVALFSAISNSSLIKEKDKSFCINNRADLIDTKWSQLPGNEEHVSLSLLLTEFELKNFSEEDSVSKGSWDIDKSDDGQLLLRLDFYEFNEYWQEFLNEDVSEIEDSSANTEIPLVSKMHLFDYDIEDSVVRLTLDPGVLPTVPEMDTSSGSDNPGQDICYGTESVLNLGGYRLYMYEKSFESLRTKVTDCETLTEYVIEGKWTGINYLIDIQTERVLNKTAEISYMSQSGQVDDAEIIARGEWDFTPEENILKIHITEVFSGYEDKVSFFVEDLWGGEDNHDDSNNADMQFNLQIKYNTNNPDFLGPFCEYNSYSALLVKPEEAEEAGQGLENQDKDLRTFYRITTK